MDNALREDVEILLIDDNYEEAQLVIRSLARNRLDNRLHYMDDSEDALDFLLARGKYTNRKNKKVPQLILLDLKMPKLNGLDILREVKSNERTKSIPVVVLTSSKEEQDISSSYELGANSYLVKPVSFESFSHTVEILGKYWLMLNEYPPMAVRVPKS